MKPKINVKIIILVNQESMCHEIELLKNKIYSSLTNVKTSQIRQRKPIVAEKILVLHICVPFPKIAIVNLFLFWNLYLYRLFFLPFTNAITLAIFFSLHIFSISNHIDIALSSFTSFLYCSLYQHLSFFEKEYEYENMIAK